MVNFLPLDCRFSFLNCRFFVFKTAVFRFQNWRFSFSKLALFAMNCGGFD